MTTVRRSGFGLTDLIVIGITLFVLLLLVVMPVAALVYGSFRSQSPTRPGGTFSLDAWRAVYLDGDYYEAIVNTFEISVLVTLLATIIGVVLAWANTRTDMPGKNLLELGVIAPLLVSPFVGATAWMALGQPQAGLINVFIGEPLFGGPIVNIFSPFGVVLVMTLYFVPYVYLVVAGALQAMDPSLEEAAAVAGASIGQTLRRITLPLVVPALASALVLVFVLASEMFSIPGLLGRPAGYTNLAYQIFRSVRVSPPEWPLAAASGTLLMWIAVVGMYVYQRITRVASRYVTVTGKGYRPRLLAVGRLRWALVALNLVYIALAVILPFGALLLGSFMKYKTARGLSWDLFTLENYAFLSQELVRRALINTLILSLTVPTLVVVLAVTLSYIVLRTRLPLRTWIDSLATLPVAIPGIVFGIGLLWAYFPIPLPIYGTVAILAIGYWGRYLPQAIRTTSASLIQVDAALEESARVHGASAVATLRRITVPLLRPAMAYAWLFTFILISREVSMAIVLYRTESVTISTLIWDLLEGGQSPMTAYALGVLQSAIIFGLAIVARALLRVDLLRRRSAASPSMMGG